MQQTTLTSNSQSQQFINQIKRLQCEPSESQSEDLSQDISEEEGERAIQQFKRQIEERFKISISNKIYSFPRKVNQIADLLSSSDEDEEKDDKQSDQNYHKGDEMMLGRKDAREREREKERGFKKKGAVYESKQKKKQGPQLLFSSEKEKRGKRGNEKKNGKNQTFKNDKQTNRSKRIHTEPDNVNYLDTLRSKHKKIH